MMKTQVQSYHVLNDHSLFLIQWIPSKCFLWDISIESHALSLQLAREEEEKQMTLDEWKKLQAKKVIS